MAIPDSIQVEFTNEVPLQLTPDRDGLALNATSSASVAVELPTGTESGDIVSVFCEGPATVWFKICSSAAGRATYASEPIALSNKEVFSLKAINQGAKYYISVISRSATKCTVNTYPRGT